MTAAICRFSNILQRIKRCNIGVTCTETRKIRIYLTPHVCTNQFFQSIYITFLCNNAVVIAHTALLVQMRPKLFRKHFSFKILYNIVRRTRQKFLLRSLDTGKKDALTQSYSQVNGKLLLANNFINRQGLDFPGTF